MNTQDWERFWEVVARVIVQFAPACSDYQIWRGISGDAFARSNPKLLYPTLAAMEAEGLIAKECREGYPHCVYWLTDAGAAWLSHFQDP